MAGQQGWVHHGGARPEEESPRGPGPEAVHPGDDPDSDRLCPHPGRDEPLTSHPVGQGAGDELARTPHGGVERGEDPDTGNRQAAAGEEQREDAPGQPVVEVVDQSRLTGGGEGPLLKLVRTNTSLVESPPWAATEVSTWVAASRRAWPCVSFTNSIESPKPSPAKAIPKKNGSGRSPARAVIHTSPNDATGSSPIAG